MNLRILTIAMVTFVLYIERSRADFVVAGNLPADQVTTLASEEVGLIAPRYNNYNNVSKGQTFIAQATGRLTEIDALVGYGSPPPVVQFPPLRVSLFTSKAGLPLMHLATREFPKSSFGPYHDAYTRETFDFTNLNVALFAGDEYMVVFATPFGVNGTHGGHSAYLIGYPRMFLGQSASQARDGMEWERFGDVRELAIEVRAVIIPEPTSLAFLCLGSVCLLRRR